MKSMLQYPDNPPKRMLGQDTPGYFEAIDYLCRNMRDDEIAQHMAIAGADRTVDQYNPRVAALGMLNINGCGFMYLGKDAMPVAAGGYGIDPYMPGVWQSWMVGTLAGWNEYAMDLTKGTRWLMGKLMEGGARRLETNVIASRVEAQKWYTDFLGMKYEGARRGYTTSGESVLLYGYTQEDWASRWEEQDGRRNQ